MFSRFSPVMPLDRSGLLEVVAELAFQHAVDAAGLLLFAQLQAVADDLRLAILAMLPGNEVALFDGALLGVAALAFQKQFHALAPALPANRANVSCQVLLLTFLLSGAVYGHGEAFFLLHCLGAMSRSTASARRKCPALGQASRQIKAKIIKLGASSAAGSRCAESASRP
jgi:hypothetical protein